MLSLSVPCCVLALHRALVLRNSVGRPITSEAFGQVAGLVELGTVISLDTGHWACFVGDV